MGRINIPETLGIVAAIVIATTVSAASEYSSSKAFEKLRTSSSRECFVRRGGELVSITADNLTVGDTVFLNAGMSIPADGILLSGNITCDQAALTGESAEKEKSGKNITAVCPDDIIWDTDSEREVFRGSLVCRGEGEMTVLRIGNNTFLGQVADSLEAPTRPGPLKHRLSALARSISFLGYVGAAMIAFAYLFNAFFIDSGMNMTLVAEKLADKGFVISEIIRAVTVAVSASGCPYIALRNASAIGLAALPPNRRMSSAAATMTAASSACTAV